LADGKPSREIALALRADAASIDPILSARNNELSGLKLQS